MPVSNLNDYVPVHALNVCMFAEGRCSEPQTGRALISVQMTLNHFSGGTGSSNSYHKEDCCLLWGGGRRGFDTPLYLSHSRLMEKLSGPIAKPANQWKLWLVFQFLWNCELPWNAGVPLCDFQTLRCILCRAAFQTCLSACGFAVVC